MATIDELGLRIKTLQQYLDEIEQAYLAIDPGWNIEPESPDGQLISAWSETLANLEEQLASAYRSVDPNTAVGQQLDRIARISGLDRQEGTFSTATVTFSGNDGVTIPRDTEVRNAETDTIWTTDEPVTISGGTASVGVTCETVGPEPAAAGDLSIIATPVGGVSGVTNDNPASLGRPRETDALFRVRRNNSVSAVGSNQVDSMFGDLANLDGVKHVRIVENYTGVEDGNGVNPNSLAIFVDGGDTQAIAEAIAANKNPGTNLNADSGFANQVQVDIETKEGSPLTVTFHRPVATSIHVASTVVGNVSTEQVAEIKQAIIDYANSELFGQAVTGFDKTGFGIGEVVPAGKLYTPVNRVLGSDGYVDALTLGTSSSDVTNSKVDPGFNGLAVFDADNITITVQ